MTVYRVGEQGATVFNADGEALAVLRPGHVVVEGRLRDPKSLASQHQANAKRQRGYADKVIRPTEDKA